MSAALTLYELAAADERLRFSPHCWKTRMALAHKGLAAERLAWHFHQKDRLAFSGQELVPVLVDGDRAIADSWSIALHLEHRFPLLPSLFGSQAAVPLAQFINSWADSALVPAIGRLIVVDIFERLDPADQPYFRASRERRFGMTLERFVEDRLARLVEFQKALTPLRTVLKDRPFLAGAAPAYADYCVFGMFMWVRCISPVALLEADDPVWSWRERLLDAFDGLARNAPCVGD